MAKTFFQIYAPEPEKQPGIGVYFGGDYVVERRHVFAGVSPVWTGTGTLHAAPGFGDEVNTGAFQFDKKFFRQFPGGNAGQEGRIIFN
jgi:hypothetical protein